MRPGLVKQIAITCNKDGGLAAIVGSLGSCGRVILLPEASNDRSLVMTSSFSSMVIAGLSLAYLDRQPAYSELVRSLAAWERSFIGPASNLAFALSRESYKRIFFIASRPFLGGAFEGHLKIQELSGGAVVARADDTLGFRHGFMAAVDKESLVVLFRSADAERRLYEEDLLLEIIGKKLGKRIVVISDLGEESDDSVTTLACGAIGDDDGRSLVPAVFGQLLGLFISLACGLKPDNPSPSGLINRVVQGVRIHERKVGEARGNGK
jgi:tagatose-6-phosphate ketose/aldose isomerase